MKTRLTLRYIFALMLIAGVLLASYSMVVRQISLNEKDAYLINISGMQRMLSQRIALMAREIHHADSTQKAEIYFEKMNAVTKRMRDNHKQLSSGMLDQRHGSYKLSSVMHDMYFKENGLDHKVTSYLATAQEFTNLYERLGQQGIRQSNLTEDIVAVARNGLLAELNDAVTLYEREAEAKINAFRRIEMIVLSMGFLTLVIEVLFIFRPMVNSVARNIEALERANAELLEFSYRISHDLRAPIVSSVGLIGVAQKGLSEGEKDVAEKALSHIEKSMSQLGNLIEDVINLTKMKMSDVPEEDIMLSSMIDEVIENVSNLPHADRIKIETHIAYTKPISTKRIFVQQTLENLISNAIKYHDPDKKEPFIKVSASVAHGKCIVAVSDNGIGVPEEYREQLFGMFKRFHPKVSFGSGLGLYLVMQNAQALDGEIIYKPTESGGSQFELQFPIT
ncbi:MAG: ATP-binding protein [Pseudomonadota bacterium]